MVAQPPLWGDVRLEADRVQAIEEFRTERMSESLGVYYENFERYRDAVENLLAATVDLTVLAEQAATVVLDPDLLYAARYLAGPPISVDDLEILSMASLSPAQIRNDPASARRVVETILTGLDRERFPWLAENRDPAEDERKTAVIASAALLASQRVRTHRANELPAHQQGLVRGMLKAAKFIEDSAHAVPNISAAPAIGHFSGESTLGTRKADVVVRLWDGARPCRRMQGQQLRSELDQAASERRCGEGSRLAPRLRHSEYRAVRHARGRFRLAPPQGLSGSWLDAVLVTLGQRDDDFHRSDEAGMTSCATVAACARTAGVFPREWPVSTCWFYKD